MKNCIFHENESERVGNLLVTEKLSTLKLYIEISNTTFSNSKCKSSCPGIIIDGVVLEDSVIQNSHFIDSDVS